MNNQTEMITIDTLQSKYGPYDNVIEKIVSIVSQIMRYWKDVYGWAPDQAAELLSRSMLDLQISLSESLRHWKGELDPGDLTLAWANLGALVEGHLKLFLSVYYLDYLNDKNAIKQRKIKDDEVVFEVVSPDGAKFDAIRIYFRDHIWKPGEFWDSWILMVQQKRNNIHAFKFRDDLGDTSEFQNSIYFLLHFIQTINDKLPYHDSDYKPYPFIPYE